MSNGQTCKFVITRGARKGYTCGVLGRCPGGRCATHASVVKHPKCCHILTKGARKGKRCGVSVINAKSGGKNICKAHWKNPAPETADWARLWTPEEALAIEAEFLCGLCEDRDEVAGTSGEDKEEAHGVYDDSDEAFGVYDEFSSGSSQSSFDMNGVD
jgi:hypothetical protein